MTKKTATKTKTKTSRKLSLSGGGYALSDTVHAEVEPRGANQEVTWSVDPEDQSIAAIHDNGDGSCTVTSVAVGTATVTATSVDGGFTADCTVTVTT